MKYLYRLLDRKALEEFRARALNPHTNPVTRGGAENDDIFFQGKKLKNEHYNKIPDIVAEYMAEISKVTGREYAPFTDDGAPDAHASSSLWVQLLKLPKKRLMH